MTSNQTSFRGFKPLSLLLLVALAMVSCDSPSSSAPPAKSGIDTSKKTDPDKKTTTGTGTQTKKDPDKKTGTGTQTDTDKKTTTDTGTQTDTDTQIDKPNFVKVEDAPIFGSDARITYYTVDTAEDVQIVPSSIGSDIEGDVRWEVTQVSARGQVGYVPDLSGIRPNGDKPNQLYLPKGTVGFFNVVVSAKDQPENKSDKILLAAGSIPIPDAAITTKSRFEDDLTVDTANKSVLVRKAGAGKTFTVGGLDVSQFADGAPKYALTYSASDMGPSKLVQAIDSNTGEVTLGSGTKSDTVVQVSGKQQGAYKARAATTLYRLTFEPYIITTKLTAIILSPGKIKNEETGKIESIHKDIRIPYPELWLSTDPTKKVRGDSEGQVSLEVKHSGTFTLIANYTGEDGKYKQSDPFTVKTTKRFLTELIPLNYGRTSTLTGYIYLDPLNRGKGDSSLERNVRVIVEVEGYPVAETKTDDLGKYEFENISHNGKLTVKTDYVGGYKVKNQSRVVEDVENGVYPRNIDFRLVR